MTSLSTSVKCLLMPLQEESLLLAPSALIADILHNQALLPAQANDPHWLLGYTRCSDAPRLPVIDYRAMLGQRSATCPQTAIVVVMHALNAEVRHLHYGIAVDAVPAIESLDTTSLALAPQRGGKNPCLASRVYIGTRQGYIPDFDALEQQLNAIA